MKCHNGLAVTCGSYSIGTCKVSCWFYKQKGKIIRNIAVVPENDIGTKNICLKTVICNFTTDINEASFSWPWSEALNHVLHFVIRESFPFEGEVFILVLGFSFQVSESVSSMPELWGLQQLFLFSIMPSY